MTRIFPWKQLVPLPPRPPHVVPAPLRADEEGENQLGGSLRLALLPQPSWGCGPTKEERPRQDGLMAVPPSQRHWWSSAAVFLKGPVQVSAPCSHTQRAHWRGALHPLGKVGEKIWAEPQGVFLYHNHSPIWWICQHTLSTSTEPCTILALQMQGWIKHNLVLQRSHSLMRGQIQIRQSRNSVTQREQRCCLLT